MPAKSPRIEIIIVAIDSKGVVHDYGWTMSSASNVDDAQHIAEQIRAQPETISARVMVGGGWA